MEIERREKEGETLITLKNEAGLSLTLTPTGAGIFLIEFDGHPMTVAPIHPSEYAKAEGYFGKTAGRIAGRIKDSLLHFDGKEYKLKANEGKNCLHGGKDALSYRKWSFSLNDVEGETAADFILDSPDGDNGFPGSVRLLVRYLISDKDASFKIIYQCGTDLDTPINLTSHTYFNLGGDENVEKQLLQINAKAVESYTDDLIPLGMGPIPECLDFSSPKEIGKDIQDPILHQTRTNGYDHAFAFDKKEGRPDLVMESNDYRMEMFTTLPAIQVYSSNYPSPSLIMSNGGRPDCPHNAVALEPVYVPNDFEAMRVKKLSHSSSSILFRFFRTKE